VTTVDEAWNAVMNDVQGIKKGDRNTQQGFNFRGIDAVMNAVGPVLRKHGVTVVPTAEDVQTSSYETKSKTTMHSAIVKVRFTVRGPAGDTLEGATFGEASDAGDKAVSKAHSVAYRTFLLQALTIPTDEPDPDQEMHERAPSLRRQLQAKVGGMGPEARATFLAGLAQAGLPTKSNDMTDDQMRQALELV
jgi:hypothetical protein